MQKITPFLWFNNQAEEAIHFYIDVFSGSPHKNGDSKIISINRYKKGMDIPGMPAMEGKILTAVFELNGQRFMALDGGPVFKFTEAVSLFIECEDQQEVDYFWEKLSAEPSSEQCGWIKDNYGLSWQIIPKQLLEFTNDKDSEKALRTINAMLQMKKIDIAKLKEAYEGK